MPAADNQNMKEPTHFSFPGLPNINTFFFAINCGVLLVSIVIENPSTWEMSKLNQAAKPQNFGTLFVQVQGN